MKASGKSLPIRIALIETLYASLGIVYLGITAAVALAIANYITNNSVIFYIECAVIVAIALARIKLDKRYHAQSHHISSSQELRRWENLYLIGSTSTLSTFGIIGATSIIFFPDSAYTFVALMAAFGATLSVCTRNYTSVRVFLSAATACFVPIMIACLWNGLALRSDIYLGVSAVPPCIYALSVYLGVYLGKQHEQALISARQSEVSSHRFNVALRSMPAGLFLVGSKGEIIVVNSRATQMLGIADSFKGTLREALSGIFDKESVAKLLAEIHLFSTAPDEKGQSDFKFAAKDRRWIQCEMTGLGRNDAILLDKHDEITNEAVAVITIQEVTEKVMIDEALHKAARFDKLTGLANRTHWEALVDAALKTLPDNGLVAICILDIDRFKLINDTLGHHIGDEVIAGVASRLRLVDNGRLIVGRRGGDEFVVLVDDLKSEDEASGLFDRVFSAISCTYDISGHSIDVKCSGGVVVREKRNLNRQEDLNRADMSLYKIKKNPDRCWMLFDDDLEEEFQATRRIKNDLKGAIARNELQVIYQPIYNVAGTEVISVEALCRWEHMEAGHIPPSKFVVMAEEIGVIGELTSYVLRTACRDCKSWGADIPVAVNLSAIDLARNELLPMIRSALTEFDLPGSKLCVEVTESVFLNDFKKAADTLGVLNEMGVTISLDDFGTGYSSLSYLSQLPLNRVKIDRSFVDHIVTDIKSQKLFRAVVSLAKELDFEIIVEGVETVDQLQYIKSVSGVDMIQGYVYSRPFTAGEMIAGVARDQSMRPPFVPLR